MLCIGMDIHKDTTTIHVFDPTAEPKSQHRSMRVPTTGKDLQTALQPFAGRCRIAFEVGTQAQWVASVVRPLAVEVLVANASRIPWLFRDRRKNDRIDAKKLAILLSMDQLPTVHLPSADVSAWRALIQHRRGLVGRLASYFGMTPTLDASGRIERHGHISKRGPSVVRWVLIETIMFAMLRDGTPFDESRLRRGAI